MSSTPAFVTSISTFIRDCVLSVYLPQYPSGSDTDERANPSKSIANIKEIVGNLLQELDYRSPTSNNERRFALEQALHSRLAGHYGTHPWFKRVCSHAAAMAELSYHDHSFEIQLQISQFTWYMIYFDDLCHQNPLSFQNVQQRILANDRDQDPILEHFREHLGNMYQFWDLIPANFITTSALEYMTGCLIEGLPSIRRMSLSTTAQSWPYYLRSKTGVSAAYAFMIFPSQSQLDLSAYIQAIGDMSAFIDLTNDVLSFYKESCAGEEHNYVHNRASVTQKSVEETLQEVSQEITIIHRRIEETLELSNKSACWKRFVNGYLAFHVTQTRYQLEDLGF